MTNAPRITERKEYLQTVLAPALAEHRGPDLFARYGLDPNEEDARVIGEQISFAVKLWRNNTDHEKYGDLVRRLLKEHPQEQAKLTDPVARRAARQTILQERASRARAPFAKLESAINDLKRREGTLPLSSRTDLVALGVRSGLNSEEAASRLDREQFVDDIGDTRPALASDKYEAIVERLASLRSRVSDRDVGPTLFSFLGAQFSDSRQQLIACHQQAVEAKDKRRYGDEKTLAGRLLVDARLYLVEGDADLYRAAVMNTVKEKLRGQVQHAKVVDGRLDGAAFQALVQEAVAEGLDVRWAQTIVQELARAERLPIEQVSPLPAPYRQLRPVEPPPRPLPPQYPPPRPVEPVPPPPARYQQSRPIEPPPRPRSSEYPPPLQDSVRSANMDRRAGRWYLWALLWPGVGLVIGWGLAARRTGRGLYVARAIAYGVVLVAAFGSQSGVGVAIWIVGVIDVLVKRKAVAEEIRAYSGMRASKETSR